MKLKRMVFWEPSSSPHKTPLINAFKRLCPGIEVIHVAQSEISARRKSMGWVQKPVNDCEEFINPDFDTIRAIASAHPTETFHIFSGIRHFTCIVEGLSIVKKIEAKFAVMSEPRVDEGIKGKFRFLQSWLTEREIRTHASCILAIGRNGPPWFQKVGYPPIKIFPFAYFVEEFDGEYLNRRLGEGGLRVGYLGRLVRAKGIFSLLKAFTLLREFDATLSLAGPVDGNKDSLDEAISVCDGKVELVGVIKMPEVVSYLSALDVLVLPSITNDDGWGVVVTEALFAGVPVVATTCVGASVVLTDSRLGLVVPPDNPNLLAAAIRKMAGAENLSDEARRFRRNWAKEHLSADVGASYLKSVLDCVLFGSERPIPFFE